MSDLWNEETAAAAAGEISDEELAALNGHIPDQERDHEHHRLTDEGMVNFLVDLYGDQMRYVDGLEWLTWGDGVWRMDGKEMHVVRGYYAQAAWLRHRRLMEAGVEPDVINRFLRQYETDGKTKSILRQAQRRLVAAHEDVNKHAHLLNCRNGVVDLRARKLLKHDPAYLQTKQTPGDYVPWLELPEADRTRFTKFLEWACSKDRDLMRLCCRSAGYTLSGETAEEVLFLLWGTTRSGKSTLTESLASVMGTGYSGSLDAGVLLNTRMARGNVDDKLAGVAGCRLVNCAEPERGERFTESLIKMITSGDKMRAAFKFVTAFEFTPRWKIWIATNHAPGSADIAVHRRLIFIPFRHTVPKNREDPSLKEWLKNPETGGRVLLSWAVEGAYGYYNDGGLRYEEVEVSQEWMAAYLEDEDPVSQFITQRVQRGITDPDLWVGTKEMYSTFERWNWLELQNLKVMRFQTFNQALQERGIVRGRHPKTGARVWREITLVANVSEDVGSL